MIRLEAFMHQARERMLSRQRAMGGGASTPAGAALAAVRSADSF
jgi:hypothetical protein